MSVTWRAKRKVESHCSWEFYSSCLLAGNSTIEASLGDKTSLRETMLLLEVKGKNQRPNFKFHHFPWHVIYSILIFTFSYLYDFQNFVQLLYPKYCQENGQTNRDSSRVEGGRIYIWLIPGRTHWRLHSQGWGSPVHCSFL